METATFVARLPRVLFSVAVEGLALRACTLCSPFSGAALAAPPLPGRGAAPHTLQSANQPIPFVFFVVLCDLCGKDILAVLRALARP